MRLTLNQLPMAKVVRLHSGPPRRRSKLCIACSGLKSQSALTPLLLLFRKKARGIACSLVNALATAQSRYHLFAGAGGQAMYRLLRLKRPERAHAAAPPFPQKGPQHRLLACKRARDGEKPLPPFCGSGEQAMYRLLRLKVTRKRQSLSQKSSIFASSLCTREPLDTAYFLSATTQGSLGSTRKPPLCKGRWHGEAVTEGLTQSGRRPPTTAKRRLCS